LVRFNPRRLIYRSWFYFRVGYGTYIALLVGLGGNLLLFYRFGVQYIGFLKDAFPSLTLFSILAIVVTVPVSIGVGFYHMKRTGAFAADAAVSTEQNPYVYKVVPGKEQEVLYPVLALTLKGLVRVLEQKPVAKDEMREFEEAIAKTNRLIQGQSIRRDSVDPAVKTSGVC
jgi:hypothetical protein